MNEFLTVDWMSMEMLKTLTAIEPSIFATRPPQRFVVAKAAPVITIPASVLVAGLAVAVAAKVPFSRRRLLMPWRLE